jgi:hypothetical protein
VGICLFRGRYLVTGLDSTILFRLGPSSEHMLRMFQEGINLDLGLLDRNTCFACAIPPLLCSDALSETANTSVTP